MLWALLLCGGALASDEGIILPSVVAEGQATSDAKPRTESDLIDGLILNRAMTRMGHRFYREFVSAWRDIGGTGEHAGLTVVEQATARSGSKILVLHNRKPVFSTVVSPVSRQIDAQAEAAAKRVDELLRQQKQQSAWQVMAEPDLAADEF
nr:curli production assembly/transport protein CsgE [Shewanella jiangmenensis]